MNVPEQPPATPTRITVNAAVMGGRPCIRGMRFPVSRILAMMAAGQPEREILANHPDLEPEDIRAAIGYRGDADR